MAQQYNAYLASLRSLVQYPAPWEMEGTSVWKQIPVELMCISDMQKWKQKNVCSQFI